MSGHTPGLPRVINLCPTTADEQERMRERAWTDLRNADPTLHAEIVRRWNTHADLVSACVSAERVILQGEVPYSAEVLAEIRAALAKAKGDA